MIYKVLSIMYLIAKSFQFCYTILINMIKFTIIKQITNQSLLNN